jgi:hypothetical protein
MCSCLCTFFAAAWALAWGGTWWGVDAYRLLHEAPDASLAPAWLAWTAPYVAGTAAAYALSPALLSKNVLRVVSSDQTDFFQAVPVWSIAGASFVAAFCQCLVWQVSVMSCGCFASLAALAASGCGARCSWLMDPRSGVHQAAYPPLFLPASQGLWQDVLTSWLGGSRDPLALTDSSALEAGVRSAMGTLVGAPRLPAFLAAPGAALTLGLMEGAWHYTALSTRVALQS